MPGPRTSTVRLYRSVAHPPPGAQRATPAGSIEVPLEGLTEASDAMKARVRTTVAAHAAVHESKVLVSNLVEGGFVAYLPAQVPPS